MQQQALNLHPVSHTHDPETSKSMERSITLSGKRKSNNEKVAWLVCRYPGKTASEITDIAMSNYSTLTSSGLDCHIFAQMGFDKALIEIRRRLSDMNGIRVRRGTKDEARIGLLKNKESVWHPL